MGPELSRELAEHQASARSSAYALLARLVSAGPTPRLLEGAALDARLARAIAGYAGELDSLAVDHQHVLGFCCPPFESALLDPESNVGGEVSDRVRRALGAGEVAIGPGGEAADHLASELIALALFAGAEADAERDGEHAIARGLRVRSRHLLDAHLLRWLPMFAAAVRRAERSWPTALLDTIEDVALQHRSVLGPSNPSDLRFDLPPLGVSLDDPATGLAEIASALAHPARAGCLVTRDDIAALGRRSGTPRGFGDRKTLLENLLSSGAGLGSIADVLGGLIDLLRSVRSELDRAQLSDAPHALRAPWQARIDQTSALLEQLRAASGS
jgi:TorA maturation chaperone TorD